jgi:hypothetical protein
MEVAQYGATTVDSLSPKNAVQAILRAATLPDFSASAQPHGILACFPLTVYLTTNYDDYMEQALAARGRTPVTEICRWNSGLRNRPSSLLDTPTPDVGRPVVYHLHGHIDDPDTFVLTEDDYLDFMVNLRRFESAAQSVQVLPPKIDELISSTSLLFLGYGLRDWNLRVLLRALIQSADVSSQKLSVSVQLAPDDSMVVAMGRDRAIQYLEAYFDDLKIVVYWGTVEEFLAELRGHWDKLAAGVGV